MKYEMKYFKELPKGTVTLEELQIFTECVKINELMKYKGKNGHLYVEYEYFYNYSIHIKINDEDIALLYDVKKRHEVIEILKMIYKLMEI